MNDAAGEGGGPLEAWDAQVDAMELGDADGLDALLDDRFTLLHLSGVEQTKAEWLTDVDAGDMAYHRVDVVETAVRPFGERAVLTARIITDATFFRVHAVWRLQLRLDYERHDGTWVAMRAVTRTW